MLHDWCVAMLPTMTLYGVLWCYVMLRFALCVDVVLHDVVLLCGVFVCCDLLWCVVMRCMCCAVVCCCVI